MKNVVLLLIILLSSFFSSSQELKNYQETPLYKLSITEQEMLLSFPDLVMPEVCKNRFIPTKVNNSQTPHFRTPFRQDGFSCGQASSTGMCFTYEMNAVRNLPANVNENLYPTHFVFNWDNGDNSSGGASYYHTLEVLKHVGTPNQAEYGGTIDFGGRSRWMTGYDLYYSAMHNRVNKVYKIDIGTTEGMNVLKNWMYDRFTGTIPGGCAITYSSNRTPTHVLPAGTEDAGKKVLISGSSSSSHSFTFLGYNDLIRYDYNGDGQYTNNIDINGDGVVDMKDCEIGGLIMCETFFGATEWADGGYCYVMYKAIADGYIYQNVVHVMEVNPTYSPLLTAKVNMSYDSRKRIKIYAGISSDRFATTPDHIIDFPIFNYQGGYNYMQGGTNESGKTIEFGLDLTPLMNYVNVNQEAKYFLMISENDPSSAGTGQINSFSIINYSGSTPVENICSQTNVSIVNNGMTTLSVGATHNYENVEITTNMLIAGTVMEAYNTFLEAENGAEPYKWSFDNDFKVVKSINSFPTGGVNISSGSRVDLGFTIDFFGEEIDEIYPYNSGIISVDGVLNTSFPWSTTCSELLTFKNNKIIVPFYTNGFTATSLKKIQEPDKLTIIWIGSTISCSATIHEDGRIVFNYTDSRISSTTNYVSGISNGDGYNYEALKFPNVSNVPNGFTYELVANPLPEDFELSEDGELTGMPTREYVSELLHFKVIDNNGLVDRISLPFVTAGVILSFTCDTPDDNIIEYGESVNLDLTVTNPHATSSITGISITASCTDPYITLTDNSTVCPDLNSLASANIDNAFSFDVDMSVPDDYRFSINFTVVSDNGTWEYIRYFKAYSPIFSIGEISFNDGNDNVLVVRELYEINISMNNIGGADANNFTIVASSDDPYISLTNTTHSAINVEPGDLYNFVFNLIASDEITSSYNTIINLDISCDNGYHENLECEILINREKLSIVNILNAYSIQPGDTRNIGVELKNIGLIDANEINLVLETSNTYITINTASNFVEELLVGNTSVSNFSITIDESCPFNANVLFNLIVTTESGLRLELPFNVIIGIIIEDFETGGFSDNLDWELSGGRNWFAINYDVFEGEYSLRSGIIYNSQSSIFEVDVFVFEEGDLHFAYKVSSEANSDFLEFYVDGVLINKWSGEVPWSEYSRTLTQGMYNLKWMYKKDTWLNAGQDAAFIDNIVFPPLSIVEPELTCNPTAVSKTMFTNQESTSSFVVSNTGGKILDYQILLRSIEGGKKSIQGSSISTDFTAYRAGETYDIIFTLNALTSDQEKIKRVNMKFPDEIFVNSSSNIIGSEGILNHLEVTGYRAELNWFSNGYGVIRNGESVNFVVNVTFSPDYVGTTSEVLYILTGDLSGTIPYSSSLLFYNVGEFWLSINENRGNLFDSNEDNLTLTFNSEGLDIGTYNAEIILYSNANTVTVPVELIIEEEFVNVPSVEVSNDIVCYPNPFSNSISLSINEENAKLISVKLCDITGKEICILDNKTRDLSNDNNYTYNIDESLSSGIYVIKVETTDSVLYSKVIKE